MINYCIKKILGDTAIIPAIMFHSIGLENTNWIFKHISEPIKVFEQKIRYLKKGGFNFIFWNELYDYMSEKVDLKLPAVMLTFDDGYLDCWTYVFPILKKYDAKATIFVSPEFVDPKEDVRLNLEDLSHRKMADEQLMSSGFLNWEEMRLMEESGLFDIQSHALTHTWYFSEPTLIDFYNPGSNSYPWMAWNKKPEHKPFYIGHDQSDSVPLGTPIYKHEKALTCRRYYPPEQVARELVLYVKKNGGKSYLKNTYWFEDLKKRHESLMRIYKGDQHYETENEYKQRVFYELHNSKTILEKKLEKKINFIAWPGGGYNEEVLSLARKAGYKAWVLGSKDQPSFRNLPGEYPRQIKRVPSGGLQFFRNTKLGYTTGREFLYGLKRHQGSLLYSYYGKLIKIFRFIINSFNRFPDRAS